jgi:DNA-binding beta-propeller fold protein YncE
MPKTAPPRRLAGRTVALFSLFLLAALVIPVSAQATWSSPVTLSGPGGDAFSPQVAFDQNGNAVFVWVRRDATTDCGGSGCYRVQARTRSAAGALSAVQTLSAAGQSAVNPRVAVDPNGNAVFVWSRADATISCGGSGCSRVEARARSATGALSAVQILSAAGQHAGNARVGIDKNGNAVMVWERYDGTNNCSGYPGCLRVQARGRSAAGALSATQDISAPPSGVTYPANVAVDPNGNAVFVWAIFDDTLYCDGVGCNRIQARARSAAGSLSAIQGLSVYASGYDGRVPQAAVDPNGNAVFVWELAGGEPERIQARARSAAGTLSGAPKLSAPGLDAFNPQLGVDQGGNAVFVWEQYDGTTDCPHYPGCLRVQARARSMAGTLSTVQTLSDPGKNARTPQVAVDHDGNAVAVWQRPDETTDCPSAPSEWRPSCLRIQARVRSAAGTLGAINILSDPGRDAFEAQVALDQSGNAAAVWRRFGGANWRIQAAVGP